MRSRTPTTRFVIYALLLAGSAVFSFPFLWLLATSLKPIEQTMSTPLTWVPRAHYATIHGKRMEVALDYRVADPSVLVVPGEGPGAGKPVLIPAGDFDFEKCVARVRVFRNGMLEEKTVPARMIRKIHAGEWHVTELSPTKIRHHELVSDFVPPTAVESRVCPRWENYFMALATIGGRSVEEAEGTVARRVTGIGEDTAVSFFVFLGNTVLVCGLGVIGAVFSNALIAYGFARLRWRGRDALFAVTLATMMVPFPVLMVPLYGIFRSLGWIGTLYPLWVPAFFGSAFNIFLMRQFFRTIPEELSEAARIDGCSEWDIFWRIILPLSKPVLAVVALFHFLYSWNDFMGPLLYLTRKHTFTLALALENYKSQHGGVQWHYLMAASMVVILPVIILFFFTQKTFIKGIATTGIKG